MKTLLTKTLSLLLIFCGFSYYAKAQDWQPVGNQGFSSGEIYFPNIVLDANNTPYVAYLDYFENHHQVRVKKYNGSAWVEVGSTGFPTMADRVSLALDPNGMPVIAYQTFNEILYGEPQNSKIRVKKFDGSSWVDVGTTFPYTGTAYLEGAPGGTNPTIALDADGNLYVSFWYEDYLEEEGKRISGASVVKYNGSSWVTLGQNGFTHQDNLTLALAPDGTPYIAYNQTYDSNGFESRSIVVMKYNGGSWVNVGAPGFSDGRSYNLNLKIDHNGTPYTAYIDSSPNSNTYPFGKPAVRKFDGSNWVDVGTSGLSDGIGNNTSYHINLELDKNGVPYIAYDLTANYDMGVYGATKVQKLNGGSWIDIGGMGFSPGSQIKDLSLDSRNNPFVFFQDQLNINKATVMRFVPQAVNTAPELAVIGNKSVDAQSTVSFQASATDDGLPNNILTYSLAAAASGNYPTGATITASGAFTWTPSQAQGQNTYRVKIVVSDGALSDEEEIQIQVNGVRQAPVLSTNSSCLPDATLSLSNSADTDKIVWYKGDELIATFLPVPALNGTTVAGGNGHGSASNQLSYIEGIFVDGSGNVYVADVSNHRIQKWAPGAMDGITVAGGNGNGSASNQLGYPSQVYVDVAGNLYVSDRGNHRIQKWAPGAMDGITVAGGNGSGSGANQLSIPSGLFVDRNGNIYISDKGNHRVQKWAPGATSGITVAGGNGQGAAENQLNFPFDIVVDDDGSVYISDQYNHRVQKWAPGATSGITVAGGNGQGAAENQFHHPGGLDISDDMYMYVADISNNRVQRWAPGATSGITVADRNSTSQLESPQDVVVDGSGNIYVSDFGNYRVQKWAVPTISTTYTPTAAGVYKAVVTYGTETVTTNTVTITEALPVSVSIAAAPSTTITAGTSVTFTATPTNGGDAPAYQWKVNGNNAGSNSATFTTSSLANGDMVTCVLTSSASCSTGSPATSNALTITVNSAPVLASIGNLSVDELSQLFFQASATSDRLLTYSLAAAANGTYPTGAAITSSGTFSWTPTEAQGPGTYRVKVVVSDGELSDEEEIQIQVSEVNVAPVLAEIGNKEAVVGNTRSFSVYAADSDIPAQVVTYHASPLPKGATFDNTTGFFSWTPNGKQVGSHSITFTASDGESTDSEIITITVSKTETSPPPKITSFSPASGPAGTPVTISGSNFTGTTAVSFNGFGTTFSVVDASTITATVPALANTGKIRVLTPAGTAESSTDFTVLGPGTPPAPSISGFSPTSGSPGTLVNISGTNFTDVTGVAFNGAVASYQVKSTTSIEAVVPVGAKSGKITVTTSGGTATSSQNFKVTKVSGASAFLAEGVEQGLMVYPNPFSGKATVSFQLAEGEEYTLSLYDAKGAYVLQLGNGKARSSDRQVVEVNGSTLKKGLYLVRLQTIDSIKTVKLILEK